MKRLNSNVSTAQTPFQETPEILQPVCVDAALNIGFSMVNDIMDEARMQSVIANCAVRIDAGTVLYIVENFILQNFTCDVGDDLCADSTHFAVKNTLNDCFPAVTTTSYLILLSAGFVHVLKTTPNVSFVRFNFGAGTTQFAHVSERMRFQGFTDSLEHEPCRFLSYSQCATNLVTRDTILAIDQHPDGSHPLVEANRRVLEDSPYFDRELLFAALAVPEQASLDKGVLIVSATRADYLLVGPAEINSVNEGSFRIGEVNNCFLKSFRSFHISHPVTTLDERIIGEDSLCVKYIIAVAAAPASKSLSYKDL
jgi:hypothetical protein